MDNNIRLINKNEKRLNKKIRNNNSSGRTGVYNQKVNGIIVYVIAGLVCNVEKKYKSFSVSKYGYNEAFKMACKKREEWELQYGINLTKNN